MISFYPLHLAELVVIVNLGPAEPMGRRRLGHGRVSRSASVDGVAAPTGAFPPRPSTLSPCLFADHNETMMEVRLADAPRADEILVALVVTDGGRPHARVGGLTVDESKKEDGLR